MALPKIVEIDEEAWEAEEFGPESGLAMQRDFATVEVWTKIGLMTFYLLVVMELATRWVHFAGTTVSPEDPRMKQIARNLSADEGFLVGKRYLLMDRGTKFSEGFRDS